MLLNLQLILLFRFFNEFNVLNLYNKIELFKKPNLFVELLYSLLIKLKHISVIIIY